MISVVIPFYNNADTLEKCIESIRSQTYKEWECILVDDGSKDNSLKVAVALIEGDPRFTLIRQRNAGCGVARNAGIKASTGDCLFFVDADDWISPECLEDFARAAEEHPGVGRIQAPQLMHLVTGGLTLWDVVPRGLVKHDDPRIFSPTTGDYGHATGCLYVKKYIPCELKFPRVRLFEDIVFDMGLLFAGVDNFVLDKAYYHYVRRKESLITGYIPKSEATLIRTAFHYLVSYWNPDEEMAKRFEWFLNRAINSRVKNETI